MKLIVSLIVAFSVLSCSSGSENQKVRYKTSAIAPSLEIPPDLTRLDDSANKALPGSNLGTRSAIGRFKDSVPTLERVLPKISGITLKGEGERHWLEVEQNVTTTYDLLKDFWAEEGFILEQDEPLIGVMKTEWLENKAGLLVSEDSFFSGFFALLSSTDTKDQYMTRVERGEVDNVTKIYLTQHGQEYMLLDESTLGKSSGWQSRVSEPELEVEMLSRMMIFLGLQDDQVKQQLAKIGQFPKRALLTKNEDEVTVLVIKESYDRGWNRVLRQLDRLGTDYVNKNQKEGVIRIKQKTEQVKQKEGFFSSLFSSSDASKDEGFVYLNIEVTDTLNDVTAVQMVTSIGANDDSDHAVALLQYLFEKLK